jgi:hypothetical protein
MKIKHNTLKKRLENLLPIKKELNKTAFHNIMSEKQWLLLMNKLLKGVGAKNWPIENGHDYINTINVNGINLDLFKDDNSRRHANLSFSNDDHTAWVIESKKKQGVYVDYDIGGS